MDIKREPVKNRKKWILVGLGVLGVVVATVALSRLQPAAPTVDGGTIYRDSVVRGEMVREVRGPGTLVPEQIRWISAVTAGRVERIHLLAGVIVQDTTVLLELANPDVQIQVLNSDRALTDAQATLVTLKTNLESNRLSQASLVESIRQDAMDAQRRADAGNELLKKGLISPLDQQQAQDKSNALGARLRLEEDRLKLLSSTIESQIKVQGEQVERLRAISNFQHGLATSMVVRAGARGILQELPLQVGQYAQAGFTLAKVLPTPIKLKAVLRIPETQAKDLTIGQSASIDTRNGIAPGHVTRVDPAPINGTVAVDVALDGAAPAGARPDLSVDGTIEIERLKNVLHTGRPAYGQSNSTVSLFKLVEAGNYAVRVNVKLGRASVASVEILSGLGVGDLIILSDMTKFDGVDRVRVK